MIGEFMPPSPHFTTLESLGFSSLLVLVLGCGESKCDAFWLQNILNLLCNHKVGEITWTIIGINIWFFLQGIYPHRVEKNTEAYLLLNGLVHLYTWLLVCSFILPYSSLIYKEFYDWRGQSFVEQLIYKNLCWKRSWNWKLKMGFLCFYSLEVSCCLSLIFITFHDFFLSIKCIMISGPNLELWLNLSCMNVTWVRKGII